MSESSIRFGRIPTAPSGRLSRGVGAPLSEHGALLAEAVARHRSTPSRPTRHRSFDPETDLVDMRGKVVLVTGGNRGKGFQLVRHLLRAGTGRVYLAARDERRALEAIALLHAEGLGLPGSHSEVVWMELDLSDLRGVRRAAEEFARREERLDVLVNNAGDMSNNAIGPDGISMIQIVNHISPYLLTKTLLPLLKRAAFELKSDVRIVNVASKAYRLAPSYQEYKTIDDFNTRLPFRCPLTNLHQYGNAKLATILWSRHLQTQLTPSAALPNGITVLTVHPGSFPARDPDALEIPAGVPSAMGGKTIISPQGVTTSPPFPVVALGASPPPSAPGSPGGGSGVEHRRAASAGSTPSPIPPSPIQTPIPVPSSPPPQTTKAPAPSPSQGYIIGIQKAITSLYAAHPYLGSLTILFACASRKIHAERESYQAAGGVYLVETPVVGSVQDVDARARGEGDGGRRGREVVRTTERFLEGVGL